MGPGVDLEKVHTLRMGWCRVQSRDLQQEAPREGAEGAAGPSIWSQGPRSGQPGLSCPAGMGSSPGQHRTSGSRPKGTLGARYHVPLPHLC